MILLNQDFLKVCPVHPDLMDDDYHYIVFEFNMNYTIESVRHGYLESKKQKKESEVDDDLMRKLGYSDSDILQM